MTGLKATQAAFLCATMLGTASSFSLPAVPTPVRPQAVTNLHLRPNALGISRPVPRFRTSGRTRPSKIPQMVVPMGSGLVDVFERLPPLVAEAVKVNGGLAVLLTMSGKLDKLKILTPSGLGHAVALGIILWSTLGWAGWSTCVLYLVLGSLVTKVRIKEKTAKGIAEGRGGARGPENVWGSAAGAALCALGTYFYPRHALALKVGFVASLATKLSDTFASEIGKAFGKRTFLITTFRPVPPGTEGAVSLEGTLAGIVGSALIAAFGIWTGLISRDAALPCLVAAFIATNIESLLGATTQGKLPWLTNETINAINTLIGAAAGIVLSRIL